MLQPSRVGVREAGRFLAEHLGREGLSGSVRYVLPVTHARALLGPGADEEAAPAEPEPAQPVFADFEAVQDAAPAPAQELDPTERENMGLILDIQLEVTARLGHALECRGLELEGPEPKGPESRG